MTKVVTYITTRGNKINICPACEQRFSERGEWPRDYAGEEYATVSHGLHRGSCDTCDTCDDA